jgi:DnaJ-class molecular chaperone
MSRAAKKDYYKILGVEKGAADKDIRKAYRKLARKYHPDLNPSDKTAETRFKEISEAYQILSDPEKRKQYDNPPQSGFDFGGAGGFDFGGARTGGRRRSGSASYTTEFGDLSDLFGNLFRGGAGGGAQGFRSAEPVAEDTESDVTIPLELAYAGGTSSLTLTMQAPCALCSGAGYTREGICTQCYGRGVVSQQETVKVKIPAGVYEGTRIRVPGKGPGQGPRRGDLYLRIHLTPDERFRVEGRDVISRLEVPAWDAALGGEAVAQTLGGPVRLKVPAGASSGTRLRLGGRGLGKGEKKGDHIVELSIAVPKELSAKQRALFEELRRASEAG